MEEEEQAGFGFISGEINVRTRKNQDLLELQGKRDPTGISKPAGK